MSLFDDASLVMIPSAYKDGKLYSIKPTDGSGDFTFTRGSNLAATRVDENGLIEKGRENLLLQSNQFNTTWGNSNSTETSGQSGYDGSTDAWRIDKTASGGYLVQGIGTGGVQTFSVYAKAGTTDWMQLLTLGSGTGSRTVFYDLTNGVIGSQGGSGTYGIDSNIESVGGGWYRCSLTFNTTLNDVRIYPAEANSVSASSGSIYIQDAQLEQGLVATDYIETTTTTAQAGILEDMPRLDYSGGASCPSLLLEGQRSNLIEYSEYYGGWGVSNASVASNQSISPEGLLNASNITDASGSFGNAFSNSITFSSADYSISLFIKKKTSTTEYLGIEIAGNGKYLTFNSFTGDIKYISSDVFNNKKLISFNDDWWYLSFTVNVSASTAVGIRFFPSISTDGSSLSAGATGTETIYGAQLEQGSYPTSYIPTYGTSQTRSVDDLGNILLPEFDDENNYSVMFDLTRKGVDTSLVGEFFEFRRTDFARMISFWIDAPTAQVRFRSDQESNATMSTIAFSADATKKICVVYDGDTFKTFTDGALVGTYSVVNAMPLSRFYMTSKSFDMNQLVVFKTSLTDAEAIALTS